MVENENLNTELNEKKKKGRKPTVKKYFDEPEENAVRLYLGTDSTQDRNIKYEPQEV